MAINNKKKENDPTLAESLGFQVRESYKKARTGIAYSIIKKGCKKIAFTSSFKGEGKTITSTNIAVALAQQVNTKVVILECDLRRPHVHVALDLTPSPGVTNYLNDECTLDDILRPTSLPNLKAICYGAIPPNPSELLTSDGMSELVKTLEQNFDYIIFDTPPVNVVVDALPMIKRSDGVVVVVRDRSTTYPLLNKAIDQIKRADGKILGIIVNRVKIEETNKDYYYRYQ